jgi:hypothetical protein
MAKYKLTDADRRLFHKARVDGGDARFFTDHYLNGWLFDHNIDDPWQLDIHHGGWDDLSVVGGFGCGKTIGFGVSYLVKCATIPHYKFLNVASVAFQSKQMFEGIKLVLSDTRFMEYFIKMGGKIIERPYPKIVIANDYIGESSMEFMSGDKQGENILSWEGDSVHIDEAGLIEDLEGLVRNLGTRLRGTVPHKGLLDPTERVLRPREARLSMSSNAWENPYMWWRIEMAEELPDEYWGRVLSTYDNRNLTDKQIRNFEKKITTDEEKNRWLRGVRPMGTGDQFSKEMIEQCTDFGLNDIMDQAKEKGLPGYTLETAQKCGVIIWELPPDEDRNYMVIGDPGQGNPPYRNAPCIGVWDYTDFPERPATLRAFWWGFAQGSYQPFVSTMKRFVDKYKSTDAAFDATGTQKMMDELVFERDGILVLGLNMTGHKHTYNTALKLFLDAGLMNFPEIVGIRSQLGNYTIPDKKIPQDIVSMFQMSAGYLRKFYYVTTDDDEDEEDDGDGLGENSRYARSTGRRHTRAAAYHRPR